MVVLIKMPQEAPAIESSFLFVREVPQDDGGVSFEEDFTHDTYRDFFRARAFANRVNSGQVSLEEHFEICSTASELLDAAQQDMLLFIAEMLEQPYVRQLVNGLSRDYLMMGGDSIAIKYYAHNIYTALRILGTCDIGDKELEERIYSAFLEADMDSRLGELLDSRHSSPLLIMMVESHSKHAAFAVSLLEKYKVKEAKEAWISFMNSGHDESWKAAHALVSVGFEEGVPLLRECASDPSHPDSVSIAYDLYNWGYKDAVKYLFVYASNLSHPDSVSIAYDLYNWGYKDAVKYLLVHASDSSCSNSVDIAYDLYRWGYQEGFDYLLDCASDPENPNKDEAVKLLREICLSKGDRVLLVDTFIKIYEKAREDYSSSECTGHFPQHYLYHIFGTIFKAGDEKSRARVYKGLEGPGEELHRQILHAIARYKPKGASPYVRAYISRLESYEPDDSEGPLIKLVKTRKLECQIDLAISALPKAT